MKKTKFLPILALVAILAVTFAGCSDDSTSSSDSGLYFHIPFPGGDYFDRVESMVLTVTAADIDSPITAVVPDSMISGKTQLDFRMDVPEGDARHYSILALDSDNQSLYSNQGDFDIAGRTDISITLLPIGSGSPNRVKLFRNVNPWGLPPQPESVLVALGFSQGNGANQYQVFNSSQMGSVVLTPGTDLVIIQANQDTLFYQDYIEATASFDDFVQNGGAMLYFCTAESNILNYVDLTLPGGAEYSNRLSLYNDVIIPDHPITAGLPDELYATYAAHGYFENLPANSLILTVDSDSLMPTLSVSNLGTGTIVYSSQPLEFFRRYRSTLPDMGGMLSRVVRFMLGYDPTPGEIPGPNMMPPGTSSSVVNAREQ